MDISYPMIEKTVGRLKKGGIIVIYDGDTREGEADLVFCAGFVSPERIEFLRKEAGGLICAAIQMEDAGKIGLPFFTDILETQEKRISQISCRKTAYGDRPAFSIPVNHRNVYTGITDNDRALTIKSLEDVLEKRIGDFQKEFYSPGHVFLLIGSGIENRKGHTELALVLGKRAGSKAMVLCEMLGSGKALAKNDAERFAEKNGFPFIEGKEIIDRVLL